MKQYKFIPEISYCIEYESKEEDYFLDFRVIACQWFETDDELTDTPFADSSHGHYSTPENAYILCSGRCKWDGCMHINWIGDFDKSYLHTCSKQDIDAISASLHAVRKLALKVLQNADFDPEN